MHLTTPAPTNRLIDAANPDIFLPPLTDTGNVPSFKYPFSLVNSHRVRSVQNVIKVPVIWLVVWAAV
jgi:hypothetical protein